MEKDKSTTRYRGGSRQSEPTKPSSRPLIVSFADGEEELYLVQYHHGYTQDLLLTRLNDLFNLRRASLAEYCNDVARN